MSAVGNIRRIASKVAAAVAGWRSAVPERLNLVSECVSTLPERVVRRRRANERAAAREQAAVAGEIGELSSAVELRRRLAAIVEHTDDAVFSLTPGGEISSWNGGADRLYGYTTAEAAELRFAALLPADCEPEEREHLRRVLAAGAVERYETVHLHRDGRRLDLSVTLSPIRDRAGRVIAASAIARDITDRKRFEGQLQYLADHDALTGLLNRRRFEEDLERELARSRRDRCGGALLTIDLDNFKEVNDALGHGAGDELIKRTAELLRSRLRTTDVLARLGGDEFAALLPSTDSAAAELVAAGLLDAVRAESGASRLAVGAPITASIGIAAFDGTEQLTAAELLAGADIAMYDAKDAGRDRLGTFTGEPGGRPTVRTAWPERIRRALGQQRLVLMAQPIVALGGAAQARHELLVRMLGDDGELIPPGAFLQAAERHDLIVEIDRWVLREGIRLLAHEQRAGRELNLSINLSASSLMDPELPELVAAELDAAGASGARLCLEVRETTAILNVERARRLAARVRELGCELAIDDFGAGFASFYYLEHLAFDYVKIDGEFVAQLREHPTNQLVIRAIVEIARGLGKRTIAECVDDRETLELLRRFGVDFAQGFLLGPPVLLADVDLSRPVMLAPAAGAAIVSAAGS